ncbi:hypothetical protein GGX14DRAFT_409971 [Mycena pura]|uniref:Ubiquitin-like domain-containing protein n=1 Tax=Mycena pura TaxID=153505 RepID=A0AAD6YUY6_9AGAR|nr:hypothetical protein GGX14DRAFT_409971 [Mycena pura]
MLVILSLAYGSFGDILESARLAKRIIDVLRSAGSSSSKRQQIISTLEGMHDDMSTLSTLDFHSSLEVQYLDRLATEVALCRSLMDRFYARINQSNSVLGRVLMALSEETELASWKTQISERRRALHRLLHLLNSECLAAIGDQLGLVGSQMQYVGSRVDSVEAQVQNVGVEVRSVGLIVTNYLSDEVSHMRSQILEFGTDVERMIARMSLHDVLDSVFFVMDPLGRPITIQLSHCDNFSDLDRILKAFLHNRPQAGGRYVERGDYSIVSPEGRNVLPVHFAAELRAGIQFDMSIVKRSIITQSIELQKPTAQKCPYCQYTNPDAAEGSWINCSNSRCERKYQISSGEVLKTEEINSPQIVNGQQEDQTELFRLVQFVYTLPPPRKQNVVCDACRSRKHCLSKNYPCTYYVQQVTREKKLNTFSLKPKDLSSASTIQPEHVNNGGSDILPMPLPPTLNTVCDACRSRKHCLSKGYPCTYYVQQATTGRKKRRNTMGHAHIMDVT